MKKRILIITIISLLMAGQAGAAHLVCDPNPGLPDTYVFTGMPAPLTNTATGTSIKADGSLNLDIATMPTGSYPITAKACKTDPIWGQACSATVPFQLVRPVMSAPAVPGNINITP